MKRLFDSLFLVCAIWLLAPQRATAVTIPTVPVGNAGNAGDTEVMITFGTSGYGSVAYDYRIGTTEVSNAQYAEFLNAKAASDPLGLYSISMDSGSGGITRTGSDGSYSYATISGRGNKPVNNVSWYDSIRFANWLHNGQGSGDTETGAYTLGALDVYGIPVDGPTPRNAGAVWFLPSEDEWYKAAYHKNDGTTGNYFDYPTSSDTAPTAEAPPGGSNSANYNAVVDDDLSNVGAYTSSDSPYGTFDQGGNVFEWSDTLIPGGYQTLRGGSFNFSDLLLAAYRFEGNPDAELDNAGFRLATVPEPSTAVLAALGLVGFAAWGWRRKR